jgi:hypothetical protein
MARKPFRLSTRGFDLVPSPSFQCQGADGIKTLSRHVQRALRVSWHGYLPPGPCLLTSLPSASDVEDTGASAGDRNLFGASCIAVLPTMRYPVDVLWHRDLVNNAVWSLFAEVERWNTEMGVGTLRMTKPRLRRLGGQSSGYRYRGSGRGMGI